MLVTLAELDYPPDDPTLLPLREQVLAWLLSDEQVALARRLTFGGHTRMHVSMEGNALYALLKLGLADDRVDVLVQRLLDWQWPDGGWNCDKHLEARVSSFNETLIPLRGLAAYVGAGGSLATSDAIRRAAEVFLQRRLFRRLTNGSIIRSDFVRLHYPSYWHYDILFGLRVLAEAGFLGDARCTDALDRLESRRLPDGGLSANSRYYHLSTAPGNGRSLVDWGGTSAKRANPWVTIAALTVLKRAGRRLPTRGTSASVHTTYV